MNNILVTGEVQIGKSTVIDKVLDMLKQEYSLNIGGYRGIRNTIKEGDNIRFSFDIKPIKDNSLYRILEHKTIDGKNDVKIYSESFEEYSVKLKEDLENCDLIILDEIGFAEKNSPKYLGVLKEVLDSDKIVFGALKKKNCSVVNSVAARDDVTLFTVDKDNRDYIYNDIWKILDGLITQNSDI